MSDYIINVSLGGFAAFSVWASLLNLAAAMGTYTPGKEGPLWMSSLFAVFAGVVLSVMPML